MAIKKSSKDEMDDFDSDIKVEEKPKAIPQFEKFSLTKQLDKQFGFRTVYSPEDVAEVKSIPTLSYTLNHASGIGGIAIGYLHEIYGDTGAGKTALSLGIIGQAQLMKMRCLYVDAENRFDINRARQFGVNTKDLLISNNNIIEQVFDIIISILRSGEVQLVVLDSLATLMSEKEYDTDMESVDMGKKAAAIGKGLKKIIGAISEIKSSHPDWMIPTIILTNQVRTNVGGYGPAEFTPGGKAPKFFSSQRIRLQAKHFFDENLKEVSTGSNAEVDDILVGARIFHKHTKNTFAPPQRSGAYNLYWDDRAVDWTEELISLGLMQEIIEQTSSVSYKFLDQTFRGRANMVLYFKESPQAVEKLAEALNLPKLKKINTSESVKFDKADRLDI